jgi:hypothetical protein
VQTTGSSLTCRCFASCWGISPYTKSTQVSSESAHLFKLWPTTKVCGPILGTSNSIDKIWPLDWLGNCLIKLVIVNYKHSHFKFQIRNSNADVLRGQGEDSLSLSFKWSYRPCQMCSPLNLGWCLNTEHVIQSHLYLLIKIQKWGLCRQSHTSIPIHQPSGLSSHADRLMLKSEATIKKENRDD